MKKQDIMANYGIPEPVAEYLGGVKHTKKNIHKQYVFHKGIIAHMGLGPDDYQKAIKCLCDILKY